MNPIVDQVEINNIIKNHYFVDVEKWMNADFPKLKSVEIRDDDVFLIGNHKSGTTWLQELVWLIGNDLNYEGAKQFIDERFPVLELEYSSDTVSYHTKELECYTHSLSYVKALKSPRFIKTHVKPSLLPTPLLEVEKKAKIIYISRNLKDVCISSYHYTKNVLKIHNCTVDDFAKVFMCNDGYWESILHFWNRRNEKNVLFLRYEEMKNNLEEVIKKVAKFLNKTLTEEQTGDLVKWLQFDKMKENDAVNHNTIYENSGFIRKGKIGGYKTEMSAEIIKLFNSWTEASLKGSDYVEYEI